MKLDDRTLERSLREAQPKKVFDTNAFFTFIDLRIKSKISIMEATIDYCEKNDIDLLLAAEVIKRHTKYKKLLAEEAGKLHMMK